MKYFSDFRFVDQFRRYLRSKSKVVKNGAEFWTFLGGTPCKISVHEPHRLAEFREVTPTTPEAIGAHMWNFKPDFKCWLLKFD